MEELKTKILLVEDDPNFGAVLKDYLSMSGYDVRLATDGEKGEDLFFKEEFNLCVLDVMMLKKMVSHLLHKLNASILKCL